MPPGIWSIEHGADLLQIEYDLLNPTAEDALLPLAAQHNIGIMARTPLARGLLTGKFKAGETIPAEQQWRRPSGDRLQLRLERVEQLRFLERAGQTLAQAALRFVLAHPAVHCVVPGARTVEQLEANVPAAEADLDDEESLAYQGTPRGMARRRALVIRSGGRVRRSTRGDVEGALVGQRTAVAAWARALAQLLAVLAQQQVRADQPLHAMVDANSAARRCTPR